MAYAVFQQIGVMIVAPTVQIKDEVAPLVKMSPHFQLFLVLWFVLNALQAALTNLDPDEAYYWMYAHALDWGYFDHPPAIAMMIKLGYILIQNELGVRLLSITAQVLSFHGIWLLVGKPRALTQVTTLIALLVSMPLLQIYGFVATPDSPLLLFSVYFLVCYQRFLEKESWVNTSLLGVCMALLLYSKYHGILLIFFTVFSNLRLLLNPKFYIASFLGALLFFPHLYWQYLHDFPSFRYHLVGRDDPYEWKHTFNYLLNQLLIFNPFLLPVIFWGIVRSPRKDALYRAFLFIISGFWVFFLYSTSKGHVEPQWTVILSIPFIVLCWRYAIIYPMVERWVKRIGIFTMVLFSIARIGLLKPNFFDLKTNFHRTEWVEELKNIAVGAPIVFENSYRDPSMFAFYTGRPAYCFTDANYRRSQFDLWDWEKNLHNKTVVIAAQDSLGCKNCEQIKLTRKIFKVMIADSLQISQKVDIDFQGFTKLTAGQLMTMNITITNPYAHAIQFEYGNMPLQVDAIFYSPATEKIKVAPKVTFNPRLLHLQPHEIFKTQAAFVVPDSLRGDYIFGLGIQTGELAPAYNSHVLKIKIE